MKHYILLLIICVGILTGCKKTIPQNGNNGGVIITPPPPPPPPPPSLPKEVCPLSTYCGQSFICMNIPASALIYYSCVTNFYQAYGASASTQDRCYFAGGHDEFWRYGGSLSGGIEYDPVTHTVKAFELSKARSFLAGATAGDKILFAGGMEVSGYSNNPVFNTVDIYEKQSLKHSIAALSEARSNLSSVSTSTTAYFIGGKTLTGYSNKMDVYKYTSDSWEVIIMPRQRAYAGSVIIEDKIYIAGGKNNEGDIKTVDVYDIQTGTWSSLEAPNRHPFASVATVNNKLVIAGGDGQLYNLIDIYNTTTQQWETKRLSSSRYNMTVVTVNNKILFLGGANTMTGFEVNSESESIDIYDDNTGVWSKGSFSLPVSGMMAATVGKQVVVLGFMFNGSTGIMNTMIRLDY